MSVFSLTNIFTHVKDKQLVGLTTSVFYFVFSLSSGVVTKLKEEKPKAQQKHNKLLYSCKNKLDCVEMLISNSIKDGINDHNEFLEILKEKKQYDCLKREDKVEVV